MARPLGSSSSTSAAPCPVGRARHEQARRGRWRRALEDIAVRAMCGTRRAQRGTVSLEWVTLGALVATVMAGAIDWAKGGFGAHVGQLLYHQMDQMLGGGGGSAH